MLSECCPVSGFLDVMLTRPFAAMLTKSDGASATGAGRCANAAAAFGYRPGMNPPPASAETRKKERRLIFIFVM